MKRIILIVIVLSVAVLQIQAHEYFPMAIGNWWLYDVVEVDSLGNPIAGTEHQSFTTIVGDTLILNQTWYVMNDSSNQSGTWELEEVNYIRTAGDTIIFLNDAFDGGNFLEAYMAILPNPVGTAWMILSIDTFYVEMEDTVRISLDWLGEILDFGSVTVPAGTYEESYELRFDLDLEFSYPETTWIFDLESEVWVGNDVGSLRFLQLPSLTPDGPEPGRLEELTDFSTPVLPLPPMPVPNSFTLHPAYPNPFNPCTNIGFSLAKSGYIEVAVYDLAGESIEKLVQDWRSAGSYRINFDGTALSSGIYVVHLTTEGSYGTQKIILMK